MPVISEYYINKNLSKEEIALRLTETWVSQDGNLPGYKYIYDTYDYFMKKLKEEN